MGEQSVYEAQVHQAAYCRGANQANRPVVNRVSHLVATAQAGAAALGDQENEARQEDHRRQAIGYWGGAGLVGVRVSSTSILLVRPGQLILVFPVRPGQLILVLRRR